MFAAVDEVMEEFSKRIPTGELNRDSDKIDTVLPTYRGRKIKLYYITQVGVRPPAFAFFVNYPEGIKQQHIRMIERMLREKYSFRGAPLKIFIRKRR
jgi:GTP-binding protein